MIEIRIPKEIREYQEKIFLGLSVRQVVAVAAMGLINIPLFFAINSFAGMQVAGFCIMPVAAIIGVFGFWRPSGMYFEEYAKMMITNNFILPANRRYETENFFQEVADIIQEEKFGQIKTEFMKTYDSEEKKLQRNEKKLRRKVSSNPKTFTPKKTTAKVEKKVEVQADKPAAENQKPIKEAKQKPQKPTKEDKLREKLEKEQAKREKKENAWKSKEFVQNRDEIVAENKNNK